MLRFDRFRRLRLETWSIFSRGAERFDRSKLQGVRDLPSSTNKQSDRIEVPKMFRCRRCRNVDLQLVRIFSNVELPFETTSHPTTTNKSHKSTHTSHSINKQAEHSRRIENFSAGVYSQPELFFARREASFVDRLLGSDVTSPRERVLL